LEVLHIHPQILQRRQQEVRVKAFNDFSILYELRFWINNHALENKIKSDLLSHAWYNLRRAGIRIPFPVREVIQAQPASKQIPVSRIEELLSGISLFNPLGEKDRKTLAGRVHTELFGALEEVVQQNTPGNSLYVIAHGKCRIFVTTPDSPMPKPVALLHAGDFFGEMSLLTGAARNATVVAEEDTECIIVSKDDVKDLLLAKPEIAKELSLVLAERQAELQAMQTKTRPAVTESSTMQLLNKIWDFLKT
jgi:CRP-like cAMP-binding protein